MKGVVWEINEKNMVIVIEKSAAARNQRESKGSKIN